MTEFDCTVKNCGRRACDPVKCKLYKEDNMSEAKDNNFETLLTTTLKQQKIIEELEADKSELIEMLKRVNKHQWTGGWISVSGDLIKLLKKHGVKI